jgi:membrane protein
VKAALAPSRLSLLADFGKLAKEVAAEYTADKVPRLAAALAYYALFSLAPLLVVTLAIAGLVFDESAARAELVRQFSNLVGANGAQVAEELLKSTAAPARDGSAVFAVVIGVGVLLLGASGVFGELQEALNGIWNVAPRPGPGWKALLRRRFLSFSMVLGSGFLLLVSLVVSAALAALDRSLVFEAPVAVAAWRTANALLGMGLPILLFAAMFRLVPDAEVRWRDAWTGALVTAALFTAGRAALGFYLGRSAVTSSFGAAGSLVALVLWVYYSAQILFLGAELTQVLGKRREHRASAPKPGAEKAKRGSAQR